MMKSRQLTFTSRIALPLAVIGSGIMGSVGCDGGATIVIPGDVTFESGQVTAPGATIIVNGQEHSEQASIGDSTLVGIVKDGQVFLYHPDLGPAQLSKENSRRAVGLFIAQSSGETPVGKLIRDTSTWLANGESTEASTGITVERVGDATYEVTNNARRWAAVKSGATVEPRFLLPRASVIETNLIQLVAGLVSGDSSTSASVQIPVDEAEIETFGAMVRARSLLWVPVIGGQLIQKAETALDQDTTLFLRLNAVDYMTVTIEGVMSIAGLFPFECADAVINGAVLNAFETLGVGLLTGDEALTEEFALAMATDMAQSTAGCVCVVSSVLVCEVLTTFLDILAAFNWVIDDNIVGTWHVLRHDAYATVEGIESDNCPDDLNKTEPGLCGCGTPDTDSDNDGTPDCNDPCPNDPNDNCDDLCPDDPDKISPGICGCGTPDTDSDEDGTPNCNDGCPNDPNKVEPGECGCGISETGDSDDDGVADCNDGCPNDPNKTTPGMCDCGIPDTDSDDDGTPDCNDGCPTDPNKTQPEDCGCGNPETLGCVGQASWQPLSTGFTDTVGVAALTVYNSELIAGGWFTTAGGVMCNRIARWNGTTWQPLGIGMDGSVRALTVYNGELIAGGWFTTAGGVTCNGIARWNGTIWQPLGTGFAFNDVAALIVHDEKLVAGGDFFNATFTIGRVADWNGTNWQAVGEWVSPFVHAEARALAVYGGGLVAAGLNCGGAVCTSKISHWNGTSWQALAQGIDGNNIASITVSNGELIAGGTFNSAGGVTASHIARWNGASWQPLDTGMNGSVLALTVYSDNVIAGGGFTTAGGTLCNRIAWWNGTTWRPLDTGMNGLVRALATYNGELIAGGDFTTASGVMCNGIAKWALSP